MNIALHLKKELKSIGMDDVVVTVINSEGSQVKFSNNKVVKTGTEGLLDINVFTVKDKKIITTSFKDYVGGIIDDPIDREGLIYKKIDYFVKKVGSYIKYAHPNPNYNGIADGPFKYKEIQDGYDKKIDDVNEVDLVEKAMNAAFKQGAKRADGILETQKAKICLVTSNKVEVEDKLTSFYLSLRAFVNKEASGHMTACSRMFNKFDVESVGKRAGEIAKMSLNPIPGPDGKFDIVFDHIPTSVLAGRIMDAASIFSVESGLSFLHASLNKKIGNFSLIDDGTLENGYGSMKFDMEGVPTQRNVVINDGVLKTYLHNTSTAKRYKTKTTASAGLISPHEFNIILDGKKGNLFDNVKNGIYVTNVWYTRFQNYSTGEFSTIPRDGAFLIKNGKIGQPIKNIRVSDNMLNIMKNLEFVSKERVQLRSWESENPSVIPKILVRNVNVTKPTI